MSRPGAPWLDRRASVEKRIELLLAEMTLAEQVGQLNQIANVDPTTDAPLLRAGGVGSSVIASGATAGNLRDTVMPGRSVDECRRIAATSRLGIPLLLARDVIHGHRTVFPIPLGLAATFDAELIEECATRAADEAASDGVGWIFAPMVDIGEDPRWGRVAESLGESAVLSGRLGAALVRGFQSAGVAACAKHYCGYGLARGGRDYAAASVGENTLRNLHLRPFRAAVDAGCSSVMAAFTDVDGIPMHAHRHLLRDVLKTEWGFDGVVVADWNGIGELVAHGVASDLRDAARQSMEAGVDVDMVSGAYAAHLEELVTSGTVDPGLVEDAVRRMLRLKFRLGLFDAEGAAGGMLPRTRMRSHGEDAGHDGDGAGDAEGTDTSTSAGTSAGAGGGGAGDGDGRLHRQLARRAAAGSFVLVKNDGVLPLAADAASVHLTGPFVDEGDALLGTWVLDGRGSDVVSPSAAFRAVLGDRLVVTDGRFADLAVSTARESPVTVALVGEHPRRSGEDSSVTDVGLPPGQLEALRAIAELGSPLVVVVFTGRALALGEVLDLADAVVIAWHPGIEAGPALADLLFGSSSPTGRLPVTFPRSTGSLPFSSNERASGRPLDPGADSARGRYVDALTLPELPFGSGLSYTRFSYGRVHSDSTELISGGPTVTVSVEVSNVGSRAGRELVMLSTGDPVAEVTRPISELADWHVVDLSPGETRSVQFAVTAEMFGYTGRDNRWRVDAGDVVVTIGSPHPDAASLRLKVV